MPSGDYNRIVDAIVGSGCIIASAIWMSNGFVFFGVVSLIIGLVCLFNGLCLFNG